MWLQFWGYVSNLEKECIEVGLVMTNFSRIRYIVGTHQRNFQGRGGISNKGTSLTFHLPHMKSTVYFVVISPRSNETAF